MPTKRPTSGQESSDDSDHHPKNKQAKQEARDLESSEESDYQPKKKPRKRQAGGGRGRRAPKVPPPVYSAQVTSLAENASAQTAASTAGIDEHIIARIKKCLDRANHSNTPEAEAKAALHIASKLMGQYNVTQAEVLSHLPESERATYAGQSTVFIERTDGDRTKVVRFNAYQEDVAHAMTVFFDCQVYFTGIHWYNKLVKSEVTFFGLADNTVGAAMAFETAINLVEKWCMKYKGGDRKSYVLGAGEELIEMAEENAAAEAKAAKRAQKAAQAAKSKEEEAEEQSRRDRLASLPRDEDDGPQPVKAEPVDEDGSCGIERENSSDDEESHIAHNDRRGCSSTASRLSDYGGPHNGPSTRYDNASDGGDSDVEIKEECDSDEDTLHADFQEEENRCVIDLTQDVDDEISRLAGQAKQRVNAAAKAAIKEGSDTQSGRQYEGVDEKALEPERRWESHFQLVKFRDMAQKIADDYLKDSGTKLCGSTSKARNVTNWDAYYEGVEDGRKIDVKRKRIQAGAEAGGGD